MNQVDLRFLTEEQRTRLREFEDLFGTSGWVRLMGELRDRAISIRNNAINLTTVEELFFAKGQVAALMGMINYDKVVTAEYEQLVSEAQLAREEAKESATSLA